jgi:hypothetical protein
MVRQSDQAIAYDMTRRMDNASIITTGFAGQVIPVTFMPLHRGDSAAGRLDFGLELSEMPRPVENAIIARAQAWCIPRPAFAQFTGLDEYQHSFHGTDITQLGAAARTPPSYFNTTTYTTAIRDSEFMSTLGIHAPDSDTINTDYVDAYNLVYNYRLASHSSKMTRANYASENADAWDLKPAFWPKNRMHAIVPDYETALVTGSLDMEFSAGEIPVRNLVTNDTAGSNNVTGYQDGQGVDYTGSHRTADALFGALDSTDQTTLNIFADMAAQTLSTTLADIDKARTTNAFAKAQAAYAGTNFSGFNNDDVIVADFMQGYSVPAELMNRPWLLDSRTVVFGTQERHATDAANLDDSVSVAYATVSLSLNVPVQNWGAVIMATIELMPERLYERQSDPYLLATSTDDLPNALRDLQRTEPVDTVPNHRIDAKHTTPAGTFGFEPMNNKWKRERTTLGGEFRQMTPGTPNVSARNAIWQADYVDPALTSDHWLCPDPMPQSVFSVPADPCVIINCRQQLTITGITQFGDALVEDNNEFVDVKAEDTA